MRLSWTTAVVLSQLTTPGLLSLAVAEISLLPSEVKLTGPASSQRLLVGQITQGVFTGHIQEQFDWSVSKPGIVNVVDGHLIPTGNGQATVTVKLGLDRASSVVTVVRFTEPQDSSFCNHVLAVLAKTGCNSGACHGALAGKGGFRLSLRGYDPESDYHAIVKQARGRRLELSDPGRSLLLAKPTGGLPHKGGLRFETGSPEYQVIADWFAAGAPPPSADDPEVTHIEMLPNAVRLAGGHEQEFIVRAHYSDGHTEDVTRWAKYSSSNESVAKVDQNGKATIVGRGVGAIMAWFASQTVISRISSPFDNDIANDDFTKEPSVNFIDELVLSKLRELRLKPSPLCSDHVFIRRAFLDVTGTLPSPDDVRSFLADTSADNRDRLIEALLARPEFVDYWTYKWSDVLLVNGNRLRPKAVKAYYEWIRNEVEQNTPWDEFARKIVTSTGSSVENGATNFFALHQDPENMAENVSQAFLGLSIACAKCHNHPLEKWTNSQYYAFANLFSRVRAKGWGGDFRSGDGIRTLYVVPSGELIQPLTGQPQPPAPLDGNPVPFDAPEDRRIHLAKWLTAPENPYFARAITNRVWASFFGVGLVEEVDDLRLSNPASNEKLLARASQHLIDEGFDLKSLMRTILQSNTYQRSSLPLDSNRAEHRFYSRYYPRRLMAEVLLDAVSQVTDVPTPFTHIGFPGGDRQETKEYPIGTRAIQLHDSAVESYFLRTFGRNERDITCECERSDEPSMVQVLHIANGDTINEKLKAKDNRISKLLEGEHSPEELVNEVFLLILSRAPSESEKQGILSALNEVPEGDDDQRRIVVEDIFWSLMSTREFLFNH